MTFLIFPDQPFTWAKHLGIMGFLMTFINTLVIFVPSIREVFGIIGKSSNIKQVLKLILLKFYQYYSNIV